VKINKWKKRLLIERNFSFGYLILKLALLAKFGFNSNTPLYKYIYDQNQIFQTKKTMATATSELKIF